MHDCGRGRLLLSNIEVVRLHAIIVIAAAAEQGQNSLVTMAAGLLPSLVCRVGRRRMSFVLLVLGIVVAASGVAAIGFGIPLNEFTLGTTLMVGGTTALTGGFILLGLSAVVGELGRLAERRLDPRSFHPWDA